MKIQLLKDNYKKRNLEILKWKTGHEKDNKRQKERPAAQDIKQMPQMEGRPLKSRNKQVTIKNETERLPA